MVLPVSGDSWLRAMSSLLAVPVTVTSSSLTSGGGAASAARAAGTSVATAAATAHSFMLFMGTPGFRQKRERAPRANPVRARTSARSGVQGRCAAAVGAAAGARAFGQCSLERERVSGRGKAEQRHRRGRRMVEARERQALQAAIVQRRSGRRLAGHRIDAVLQLVQARLLLRENEQQGECKTGKKDADSHRGEPGSVPAD